MPSTPPSALIQALPHLGFGVNMISFALLILGLRALKRGEMAKHQKMMKAAGATLVIFLVAFATRIAMHGFTRFQGDETVRSIYLMIHGVHMLIAIPTLLVLIPYTFYLGFKGRIAEHPALARWTAGLWITSAATSIPVYWLLFWN